MLQLFLGWAFDENYKLPATDDSQSGDDIAPSTDDTQGSDDTTDSESETAPTFFKYVAKTNEAEAKLEPATFDIEKVAEEAATNTVTLYAVWETNGYTVNFFQGDKKIGEQKLSYDDDAGKLTLVKDLSYVATKGYEFAGWSFKNGGTVSYADGASVKNLTTGADEDTKVFNLYVVEKEKIYTVTLNDDFDTIGKNLSDDIKKDWKDVVISARAADDKVVKPAAESTEPAGEGNSETENNEPATGGNEPATGGVDITTGSGTDTPAESTDTLETTGIDNNKHQFVVKYSKALNDIEIPVAPGFKFDGYFNTVSDESEGATKAGDIMYYDASGNAVKNAVFTEDTTLTAKWTPIEFNVVFQENGKQIDKMTQEYGQPFKMPESVNNISFNADYEIVGWTSSVDNQHPATAKIATMDEKTKPDKFDLRTEYSADVIAKLYNNNGAEVVLYPVYKTTVKYDVKFYAGDIKGATNLPATQKVAEGDTFTVKFDDDDMRTPYCAGYTFIGWDDKTTEDITPDYIYGATNSINDVSRDISLYAVWIQEITATNKTVTLKVEATGNTYALNGLLFNIPEGYGKATYSLPEGVDGAAIDENGNIIVSKVGTYEVKVTTAATEAVPSAEAKATLTVNAVPEDLTLAETIEQTKLRLKDHADAKNPGDFTNVEKEAYTAAINSGYSIIAGAESVDEIETKLSEAKKKVDEALDKILADRAADAAIIDAQTAATEAETEAATVKKEAANYKLNDDVTAIETAMGNVATAKAAIGNLPANATTEEKNAVAEELQKAVEALEKAIDNAKINVAAAAAEQQAGDAAAAALATAKANAKDRLEDVYDAKNQSDYREAQQAELTDAKNAGIEAIDAATTPDEVSAALATAKNALNSVKTDSTLTKEEEAAAAEEAAKKAAEEAAAKKAAEEAAAKKAAEEAAAKKAAEEAAAKKAAEEAAAKKAAEEAAAKKAAEEAAAKKAADQAAANAVITKINAIGSPVTAESKSAIDAARSAYDALTADQKQYVSQEIVTILTNAEATYKSVTTPKPTYFGEWVDGVWYNADGSQTYGPKGGWKSNSTGWWYEDEVGWYPANCWQKIDGQWYYFDSSGYRAENEWRGGYWLGADGAWTYQPTGSWHLDGYGWWYEDTTGWYPTNCWLKIDGYWYYFGGDGYMLTNQYIDGYWVGADGACW